VDSVKKYLAASQIHPDGTFFTAQPLTGIDHVYIQE
jgi:hypothetical protein